MFDKKEYSRNYKNRKYRDDESYRNYCKDWSKKQGLELKLRALQIVSGAGVPCCSNCGCNDIRALELNHKYGGGTAERKKFKLQGYLFHRAIISGARKVDDLEVLCKVCNAVHCLEQKFKLRFEVKFLGLGLSDKERALSRLKRFGGK